MNKEIRQASAVVWIASYPKSGNTWVQSVVRKAGQAFGYPSTDLDVYKLISEKRLPEPVRGIRPKISREITTVLKTHNNFAQKGEIHPALGLKTAAFVYVMRNPLDVLLSYINFTRMQYEKNTDVKEYQDRLFIDLLGYEHAIPYEVWAGMKLEDIPRANLDHALKRFTELDTEIPGVRMTGGSWINHCLSWHEAGQKIPSVILKYEDLLNGSENFMPLRKIFTFTVEQITEAVEAVNQQQRSLQYKKVFFNKMSSYYFSEFFSESEIAKFLIRFETELKLLGYGNLYK
jgi:hypothetical protein